DGEDGSGVERTEYRVGASGDWQEYTEPIVISDPGDYEVFFRSRDNNHNTEEPKSVSFSISEEEPEDTTAPQTTASLDPESPGAGGTYDEPVTVTLSATDPSEGGSEPQTHEITGNAFDWEPANL